MTNRRKYAIGHGLIVMVNAVSLGASAGCIIRHDWLNLWVSATLFVLTTAVIFLIPKEIA